MELDFDDAKGKKLRMRDYGTSTLKKAVFKAEIQREAQKVWLLFVVVASKLNGSLMLMTL